MRRFTSVFANKRDKQDSSLPDSQKLPRTHTSLPSLSPAKYTLKRAHTLLIPNNSVPPTTPTTPTSSLPSTPQLSSRSDPAHSSVSSNDSTSLRTPDDDHNTRTLRKKSWVAWLGRKSSSTIKQIHKPHVWDRQIPTWQPTPPPILPPPPTPHQPPRPADDTDEDTDSDSDSDQDSLSASHTTTTFTPHSTNPTSIAQSRKNLKLLIQNSLVHPLSPSPFIQQPDTPIFPRSCHRPRALPPHQTMRSTMHKTHLLRRLQLQSLTTADELSISPFSSRPTPTPITAPPPSIDEPAVTAKEVLPSSPGLRRWMARPCFEDRFAIWVPANGSISCLRVPGTAFAVAELEYSETLEAMAGFDMNLPPLPSLERPGDVSEEAREPPPVPEPEIPSATSGSSQLSVPAHARISPYIAVPSPLRNQHNPTSISPSSSTGDGMADAPLVAPAIAVKRGVRFVEEDKDDLIPIGYTLRMKKRREEKAKFLREEQERRAFEEERAKAEEERRKRDKERNEWEKERKAWEREKKAMEEERKQRLYAEEVAASRLRRESQRAGVVPGSSANGGSGGLPVPSSSSTSLRELERNRARESIRYSRPVYDSAQIPRRQASEPAVPTITTVPSTSLIPPHVPSPGNSRPPSIAGQSPGASGSGSRRSSSLVRSRPPSVHSSMSSSEDTRPREPKLGIGKRNSMASLSSGRPPPDNSRSSSYPTWSGSSQNLLVPPVPAVPPFAMDMPLLPPTPPFMLHQYPRQRSQHSASPTPSNSSSSQSPRRLPSNNHSSEQVNVQQRQQQQQHRSRQSSSSPRHSGTPSSSSSSPRRPDFHPTHQRRSSGDSRRSSLPQQHSHSPAASRSQPNSLSRGRAPLSATMYLQTPSPWTAMPSQQQQWGALPTRPNMDAGPKPPGRKRQTVIS